MGLDPSLTGTAMAGDGWSQRLTVKNTGLARMRIICDLVERHATETSTRVVLIEGPAFMSNSGYAHERAGLWWMVFDSLDFIGLEIVSVPPSSLKKYATGKGTASKEEVLAAAIRRLPWFAGTNNDEADAAWLFAMGNDHYNGVSLVPTSHRVALEKIAWPELISL